MVNENIDYFDFVKSQDKSSVFSNPNIKQLISAIVKNEKMGKPNFTDECEEKIAKLYMRMYFSLVIIHLARGEALGVACQKTLATMNKLVESKNDKYLTKAKERFNPELAKINMKDNKESKRKLETNNPKDLEKAFEKEFTKSLEYLNKMLQEKTLAKTIGKSATENMKKESSFNVAKQNAQKLIQNLVLQQSLYQRAA